MRHRHTRAVEFRVLGQGEEGGYGDGIERYLGVLQVELMVYCLVEERGERVCDWVAEEVGNAG